MYENYKGKKIMTILKLEDYQNEVFDKVKEILSSGNDYFSQPQYKVTDEQIRNIIGYFAKHKLQYNTETGVTTLDGEWDSSYSNKEDIPSEDEAVDDFIHSSAYAYIINAIQNPYFDNDKLVYKHESYKGRKTMKKRMNEDAKIIANLYNDFKPWSGAVATWEKITDADMLEDLDRLIEETYPDGITMTGLNDLLWFEDAWVLEQLGLAETEDEDEEEYDESFNENEFEPRKKPSEDRVYLLSREDKKTGFKETIWSYTKNMPGWKYTGKWMNNESLKSSRKSSKAISEDADDDEKETIWDYLVNYDIATDEEIRLVTSINGYSVETLNDIIYARTGSRDIEQLKAEYGEDMEESLDEISDEVVAKVGQARAKELGNAERAFNRKKMSVKAKSMQPGTHVIKDENPEDLEPQKGRLQKAQDKAANFLRLRGARNRRQEESLDEISDELVDRANAKAAKNMAKAIARDDLKAADKAFNQAKRLGKQRGLRKIRQGKASDLDKAIWGKESKHYQESLSTSLIKSAKAVLSMNESDVSEVSSWSFKAKGFSKIASNKQPTFGNSELNGTIHENLNGNISGIVMTNHAMSREEVEESLKNALMDNGFKTTVISELVNLY